MPIDPDDRRCPRCGCTLLIQLGQVVCSLVTNGHGRPCRYGMDAPVTVAEHDAAKGVAR